jgi:TPP-dependent pyruvate/acetoin dehydrogenase alpha subunit
MSKLSIELYKKVYLIRFTEEKIRAHYNEDEMKTPVHLYIGGEAIASGVCEAIGKDGKAFSTYRSHGVYLAKTGETDKFFAEMFGKETGIAKGKAGSMHMSSPEHGFMGASAVVGTNIPTAVGAAFANVYRGKNDIVATFFGDGATDEGVFWESLNLACLLKLPVLFVCEDNGLAIHTTTLHRHGYDSINDIISKYRIYTAETDTTDPEIIYKTTLEAIDHIYKEKVPAFLHFHYYRYYEHVGINHDFTAGYRSEDEFQEWLKVDPVIVQRKNLIKSGFSEEYIKDLEDGINDKINKSFEKAKKDSYPEEEELYRNLYA